MEKVWQEFYCGECSGYFRVKLNFNLNYEVEMVCPNCSHKHRRVIQNGQIYEKGRFSSEVKEEIMPPKSAYSKEPLTNKMAKNKCRWTKREGVVINNIEDISENNRQLLNERWFELYGGN